MSENKSFVAIIVLNWNGYKDTEECIESLLRLEYTNYKIIIVDNASSDNSVTLLRNKFADITIIENKDNLGYAEGNNVGIRYAFLEGCDYVWILNNDTIVDPYALAKLIDVAESDVSVGILGSKICYYDAPDILWFAGGYINWDSFETPHVGIKEKDCGQYDEVMDCDRITGCSMLVSRRFCEEVGLMDSAYFIYVEEVDWCIRAWSCNFRVVYVPDSKVYHKVSRSVKSIGSLQNVFIYYKVRNTLYLINKLYGYSNRNKRIFKFLSHQYSNLAFNVVNIKLVGAAIYDYITGRMGKSCRLF
jgi:GT2 family glycosyltransferase